MNIPPIPVIFTPIFKPRIWGGRKLAAVLDKKLPPDAPIGESWEIAEIGADVSRVASGPLAGASLADLRRMWGRGLLGGAAQVDGRFPLLIKFLDAAENLSVQVHPRGESASVARSDDAHSAAARGEDSRRVRGERGENPQSDNARAPRPAIKDEAWFVIAAEPDAQIFAGVRPGVSAADVQRAAGTHELVNLLRAWPVRPGHCFFLPSGTMHALGAGVLVAEVQTPSDTTYRLYDWDRVDAAGKPRELHLREGIEQLRLDVPDVEIVQPRSHIAGPFATITKLMRCDSFALDRVRFNAGLTQLIPHAEMTIWIVLAGAGRLARDAHETKFVRGDTVLIPADSTTTRMHIDADADLLEVTIPIRSPFAGTQRPAADTAPDEQGRGGLVSLTRPGKK